MLRVLPVRVTPVDDDVSFLQIGEECIDHRVYGLTRTDHHHDLAGTLDTLDEGLEVSEA